MANDAREIYEAVIGEVRKDLAKGLEEMGQHAGEIAGTYDRRIKELEKDLAKAFEEIGQDAGRYGSRIEELESRVHALEKRLDKAEKMSKKEKLVESSNGKKAEKKASAPAQEKVDMSRYEIEMGYRFNGWVYYRNKDMGNFLYRVRTDGTDNQQLTDYSVNVLSVFNVKDGKLFFLDCHSKERWISIS